MSEAEKEARRKERARVANGPNDDAIREGMSQLYALAGMAVTMVDAEIGTAVVQCTEPNPFGPGAPEAWVALAKQYPAVRRAIASMGGSATIAAMFTAHLPLLMVLQAKVGQRGGSLFGSPSPAPSPVMNGHASPPE